MADSLVSNGFSDGAGRVDFHVLARIITSDSAGRPLTWFEAGRHFEATYLPSGRLRSISGASETQTFYYDADGALIGIGGDHIDTVMLGALMGYAASDADGSLINSVTGEPVSATTYPAVLGTTGNVARGVVQAAADADTNNGVAGTLLSTPTDSEALTKQLRLSFLSVDAVRRLQINVADYSGLACGGWRVTFMADAADDMLAAIRLAAAGIDTYTVLPGTCAEFLFDVPIVAAYIAALYASGTGYSGATATVTGSSYA